jgi:phosphohistidine phosphatase SixA
MRGKRIDSLFGLCFGLVLACGPSADEQASQASKVAAAPEALANRASPAHAAEKVSLAEDEAEAEAKEQANAPDDEAAPAPTRIYVVRHAEKQAKEEAADPQDPPLTELGMSRADDLAKILGPQSIDAIYTTDYQRTRQTIEPLARDKRLESTIMEPKAFDLLVDKLDTFAGKTVVVSGHSNTVPELLAALGVEERVVLEDDDYGDLFVVTIDGGEVELERRRYGDARAAGDATPVPAVGDRRR